ncbi:MAG: SDR family NAD(P)-dependent oxidoreductase [Acidimicrobiia bacterium]|nr:SDR family NAD(P)-dependent oxidoreductase [Acidimicrobiia bacterium]
MRRGAADRRAPTRGPPREQRRRGDRRPVRRDPRRPGGAGAAPQHARPLRLAHAALPGMLDRGRGALVLVSSLSGLLPVAPRAATYAATKAFLASLGRSLHVEVAGTGVQVMVLCPGFTRTGFQEASDWDQRRVPTLLWTSTPQVVDRALRDLERGRVVSIPGLPNRVLATAARVMPAGLTRAVTGRVMRRYA